MKNINLLIVFVLLFSTSIYSQKVNDNSSETNYWQISPRVGYDFPNYDEDFPNIGYEGGLDFGVSVNKYWTNWGIQFDFDYLQNSPKADNILDPLHIDINTNVNPPVGYPATLDVRKNDITRMYFGIGPAYKYQSPTNMFTMDFALTAGVGKVDNGEILVIGNSEIDQDILPKILAYHSGFDDEWVVSIKPGIRANYFFNQNKTVGLHAGVYYLRHFGVGEGGKNDIFNRFIVDDLGSTPLDNNTSIYYFQQNTDTFTIDGEVPSTITYYGGETILRGEEAGSSEGFDGGKEKIDVGSFGVYAGLSFRIFPNKGSNSGSTIELVEGAEDSDGQCSLSITAKDQISGKIMPDTDIMLINSSGQSVDTGVTNSSGTVVFDNIASGSYTVRGKYGDVELQEVSISSSDINNCSAKGGSGVVQKDILYTNQKFILQGTVVECNKSNPIQGVDIMAKNTTVAEQLSTISDNNGAFAMQMNQATTYAVQGKKSGYFSNIQMVNTNDYNRNRDFAIKMQMCVDPCGQAIKLDNIQFDLDSWKIKTESIPDLKYIMNIMDENPNIIIEMTSHTDSRGSAEYNQTLSQRRAQSTVNWLVEHGADKSRLRARGAGETELLNDCSDGVKCTEAQHAINRRTEFKVLCP